MASSAQQQANAAAAAAAVEALLQAQHEKVALVASTFEGGCRINKNCFVVLFLSSAKRAKAPVFSVGFCAHHSRSVDTAHNFELRTTYSISHLQPSPPSQSEKTMRVYTYVCTSSVRYVCAVNLSCTHQSTSPQLPAVLLLYGRGQE